MVPKLVKGGGIKGTALYILHDERSQQQREANDDRLQTAERVGLTATRNLSTDDADLAWKIMCRTAASHRELKRAAGVKIGKDPKHFCAHLMLAWDKSQHPDRAEMLAAADGALKAMGYEKMQAIVAEHKDKEHSHIHILVNLIDPETGRAAPNIKDDYARILQPWAHEWDKAHGLNVCTERTKKMEAKERGEPAPKRQRARTRQEWEAGKRAANDDRPTPRTRAEKVDAYRAAVAQAREAMRPEWGQHYKQQRAEAATLARTQAETAKELGRCKTAKARSDFYNRHREEVWCGLDAAGVRPGNSHTLTTPATLRLAIEKAQEQQRWTLETATAERRDTLVQKAESVRQEAQRKAFSPERHRQAQTREKPASDREAGRVEAAPRSQAEDARAVQQEQVRRSEANLAAYGAHRDRRFEEPRDRDRPPGDRQNEPTRSGAGSSAGSRAAPPTRDPARDDRAHELEEQRRAIRERFARREIPDRDRDRER